jgi:hypothetical protein
VAGKAEEERNSSAIADDDNAVRAVSRCQLAAGKAEEERNSSAIADDDNAASGQLALDNAALEATAFAFG